MEVVIDYDDQVGKHPLYLINISIVVTSARVVAFDNDIRCPVIKHAMHDGNVYRSSALTNLEGQASQHITVPTIESRYGLFSHHTNLPLVNLVSSKSCIAKIVACGEIETAHPGYLGSQDTFYVGTFKGVGRVYQQTFIDTYSKVAFAKLYTNSTSVSHACRAKY